MSATPQNRSARLGGLLALSGVIAFLAILVVLHGVQPDYDPNSQLMSELVLGRHGWAMLPAFLSLALATLGLEIGLSSAGATAALKIVLLAAAACFAGSGIFPLGETSELHIALIASAFVLVGLATYLLPSGAGTASRSLPRAVSWSLGAGMAFSVVLGHTVISMGVGQRIAAAFLLSWLAFVGWKLLRASRPAPGAVAG